MNASAQNGAISMNGNRKIFTVSETDAGLRLDKFLALKMPDFSRAQIQKFDVTKGEGTGPSGALAKMSEKIRTGDEYTVSVIETKIECPVPESSSDLELDIVYQDDDIIVVNKPRGIAMYPGAGREPDTVVGALQNTVPLSTIGGCTRPGVVHRLDKDTSGLVVLAKTDAAYRVLVKTFSEHDITRKYVAFVWGIPNWESADISGNIGRSSKNRQKMTMVKVGGRPAYTKADVINAWPRENISELRCTLLTGRTHQIRVHLSAHGFPVLCDPIYGRGNSRLGSVKDQELLEFLKDRSGQMLHAEVLEFAHPITGESLKFKSRLPFDMRELKGILNGDTDI